MQQRNMKISTPPPLRTFKRKPKEKIKNAVSVQPFLQEKQSLHNVRTSGRTALQRVLQVPVWSARKACAITGLSTLEKEVTNLHELSIACEIFEQVISTAKTHGALEVKHVTLQIGRLSHT